MALKVLRIGLRLHSARSFASLVGPDLVLNSPFKDVVIPKKRLVDIVFENSHKWENLTALECGLTGRQYTYKQLKNASKRLAWSLHHHLKVSPRQMVAIALPNIPEFAVSYLAVLQSSAITTNMNPLYNSDEIYKLIKDSDINHIIVWEEDLLKYQEAIKKCQRNIKLICIRQGGDLAEGIIDWQQLVDSGKEEDISKEGNIDDTSVIFYSSGTTGLPKGVCLTDRNIVSNICQMLSPEVLRIQESDGVHQDVLPAILPFFHCYGNIVILLKGLTIGCKIVTLPKFDPPSFLRLLNNNSNMVLYAVPPMIFFMGSNPELTSNHLRGIKTICTGAAPCSEEDLRRIWKKRNDLSCFQAYGLTEASPVLSMPPITEDRRETIGCLMPNTKMRCVDLKTGKNLPSGANGELQFLGPQIMKGYLNNPQATSETIDKDGWLKTGDIGHFTDDGFICITDRLKELIKVKGFQVAPAELEQILRSHPKVKEVGVVGVPSPKTGETPVAFVSINSPESKSLEQELMDFVANQVSSYKRISQVRIIENIPKTASGKILRKELRLLTKDLNNK